MSSVTSDRTRTRIRPPSTALVCLIALCIAGCQGLIGDLGDGAKTGSAPGDKRDKGGVGGSMADPKDLYDPDDPSKPPPACSGVCAGTRAPLRRLTRTEYNNTVHDLLGDTTGPADAFPPDGTVEGFATNGAMKISPGAVQHYMTAAEKLAKSAVSRLGSLFTCSVKSTGASGCADRFIKTFGRRVFRRPLTRSEAAVYRKVYDSAASTSYQAGIEAVIATLLQSPYFLYRIERRVPSGGKPVALDGYELATRLSYLLWASTPDDALLDAAAAGKLGKTDGLVAQAKRMLADPKAARALASFHRQWLDIADVSTLSKSKTRFPDFDKALATSMAQETERFVDHVVRQGDGKLSTLLTASYTVGDARIAKLYGATHPGGSTYAKIQLDPKQRAGLLTHASVLAVHAKVDDTGPVQRGKLVRERLLCHALTQPPGNVDDTPPAFDPDVSRRQQYAQHSKNPVCAGCHKLTDPIGFSLEHYDGIGAYRAKDNGRAIDDSGVLVQTQDINGSYHGGIELARKLATSQQVRRCVARHWYRFALGRTADKSDVHPLWYIDRAFAQATYNIRTLLLAVVKSAAFRYAAPIDG